MNIGIEKIIWQYEKLSSFICKAITRPNIKNIDDTIEKIIKDKCSVSRFGDGEMSLMRGSDIPFQFYSKEISLRLKEILASQKENHIICLPDVFNSLDEFVDEARIFWKGHILYNRIYWYKYIDNSYIYYNAFISRMYYMFKDKSKCKDRFEKIKSLWDYKNIIIVEGEKSRLGVGNDLFDNARSLVRIIGPSKNAFSKYDDILNEILKQDKSKIILLALGPTATVLAYDLHQQGYQAIDIGHIDIEYEWFLQKATKKIAIKDKYVNEVIEGREVSENLQDEKYNAEIISKIK